MELLPVMEINGRLLYYCFVAGAKKILENQQYLNKINVFPVRDGDTGSNMAGTLSSIIESIRPAKSYCNTATLLAEAALTNARGNSGIIFSQFLYGISREAKDHQSITIPQFAEALKKSVACMYEAVANPVEGTMLTVIKEWSCFIYDKGNLIDDFNELIIQSREVLKKSLAETKTKLSVLSKANVVDAGANAFVLFIEGIIDLIHAENIRDFFRFKREILILPAQNDHFPQEVSYRYCTEAILKNLVVDQQSLTLILLQYGDSVVVGGNEKTKHIHVHTNKPAALFHQLKDISLVTMQKTDDILRQSEVIYNRKNKIALVTDSTCDLPQQLIDHYQIHLIPLNIHFGERHYLDKITIQPDQFYELLDYYGEVPRTSQINEKTFSMLYAQLAGYYDSVIAIHLTDKFSGTFYNSQKAALPVSRQFNKPITVINSRNLSGALGLIILRTAQAIEAGHHHDEIVAMAEKWIADTRIFVSVKTLKYMVRGGRVSATKGFIAEMLNINPIVTMDPDGNSSVFGKAYSQLSNMKKVMDHLHATCGDREVWNYIVLHAANSKGADWYTREMKSFTGKDPVAVVNISPVIGASAGIGAASVAFMFK